MDSIFKILYVLVDLTMVSVNINDIAIITVENVDYHCINHNISKFKANKLLKSYFVEDCGYM